MTDGHAGDDATTTSDARVPTRVDAVADAFVGDLVAHDPLVATAIGASGHDRELPALDPDWHEAGSQLRRRVLGELDRLEPVDDIDRVTVAALRETLGVDEDLHAIGADRGDLNNIESPLQRVRDAFDLMPTATADHWDDVAARLAAVPTALEGYAHSLRSAAADGLVPPVRQVEIGIAQCEELAGAGSFFLGFAADARPDDGELPASLREALRRNAEQAAAAYGRLATVLREDLRDRAPQRDAVGRERYAVHSRAFLGARVDLDETYAWGQEELARIEDEMRRTADRIVPGGSVTDAVAFLDQDPAHLLHGTAELQAWMQETADGAIAALAGSHFDIPDAIRRIECRIAPTQNGGIYYTGPSEDLTTRPGRMWWSVPPGVTEFGTWREKTTVFHEGVPGHHLQVAQTAYRASLLNRWRRLVSWVSGHGEGWALYAERLMADLGFLDDPADFLGMLDGQSMRAARVVLDIGVHCELPAPAEVGGGAWDYDKAWRFLSAHVNMAEGFRRFELDRYLGWPGQAPSYKVGERLWLQLRDEVRAAEGDAFDLPRFHRRALDVGSVGLDVLRAAVLGTV